MPETIELETVAPGGDVAAALDAAQPHAQVLQHDVDEDVIVVATRDHTNVTYEDLERYRTWPSRSRGTVRAFTADGFVTAVKQRIDEAHGTAIYADPDQCRLVAVLNDDGDLAGWRDHRVELTLKTTPEWQHWTGHQGLTSQGEFAQAIEDGEDEIIDPSATVMLMLEMAQTFEASTGAKFRQQGRLRDGRTQFSYVEEIEATAGEGLVEIPQQFTIRVRPFYGAEPADVMCRLRYRLKGGALEIGYTMHRPDEVKRTSFAEDIVVEAGAQLADHPLIEGTPADALRPGR